MHSPNEWKLGESEIIGFRFVQAPPPRMSYAEITKWGLPSSTLVSTDDLFEILYNGRAT